MVVSLMGLMNADRRVSVLQSDGNQSDPITAYSVKRTATEQGPVPPTTSEHRNDPFDGVAQRKGTKSWVMNCSIASL